MSHAAPPMPAIETPHHFITGFEGGPDRHERILELASAIKADPAKFYREQPLAGRVLTAIFLNPSLRTRVSLESALTRLGGHLITVSPGSGGSSWGIEFADGVVMDGNRAEHIREAAGVLSSYSDAIGMRSFASMRSFVDDMEDTPIRALAAAATRPVISLESALYHPCQALADALTLRETHGADLRGKRFVLAWSYHPKMCGVAVPHSALLTAARLGMDVTIAHPEGFELHRPVLADAVATAEAAGGSISHTHALADAVDNADVIYAKAWGSPLDYGHPERHATRVAGLRDWQIGAAQMTAAAPRATFMHCLPVRRNVVVSDAVLDSAASVVQQQAANRMWAQMALLMETMG